MPVCSQLLTLLVEGNRLFPPNGANPCDNLHLELRLFYTTQQHRTDCHENGAAKALPCSHVSFGNASRVWRVLSFIRSRSTFILWSVFAASAIAVVAVPMIMR